MVGELGDPGAITILAIGVDRLGPHGSGRSRIAWRTESLSSQPTEKRMFAFRQSLVNAYVTADVGPDQDLTVQVLGRELRERPAKHGEVVLGGVGPRIPGSQDRRERLAGLVQPAAERVEPVAVLLVAGRDLLVRVRGSRASRRCSA